MKKIILFICILLGLNSCDIIAESIREAHRDAKGYGEVTKSERKQDKIGRELIKKNTQKIVWNEIELIIPENTAIDDKGRLVYDNQELEIKFHTVTRKENICGAEVSYKKEWYKKYNDSYYILEFHTYQNLIFHTNSNLKLAKKIARENNFTEC